MSSDDRSDPTETTPATRRFARKPTKKQTQARRKNAAKARAAVKRKRETEPGFATNPRGHPETLRGGKKGRTWITAKKQRLLRRIGHWKNRLPEDHPAHELGMTIDAFRAFEILEEDLTPYQRERSRAPIRRIKEMKAQMEKAREDGDYDD
jgi:hypothetical protein